MLLSAFRLSVWATVLSSMGLDICAIIYTVCSFRLLQDAFLVNALKKYLLYAIPIHFLLIVIAFLFRFIFKRRKIEISPFVSLRFTRSLATASKIIGVVYSLSIWAASYNGVDKGSDLFTSIMLPVCIPFFAYLGFDSIRRIMFPATSEQSNAS